MHFLYLEDRFYWLLRGKYWLPHDRLGRLLTIDIDHGEQVLFCFFHLAGKQSFFCVPEPLVRFLER